MPSITDCESFSLLGLGEKRKKIIHPILKPTVLLVLKANAEIMRYKFQNKFTVFELKYAKCENSEKIIQVKYKHFPVVFHNVFFGQIFTFK